MSEKPERFEYPIQYKVIAHVAPLLFIFAAMGVSMVAWQNLRATEWINEAGQQVNPAVFYVSITASILLAAFFGVCIHITYPTILKNKDGFQLVTYIYTSRWFSWNEISKVSLPPSNLVTQIYTIGVPGLHPVYWAIGLSRGLFAPGFLIHPRMINGGKLLRVLIKQRPELFED
ncbi:MAG: hypothetical protein ACI9EW_003530 [Cellvibrionaceae bacterium]|jgi:hypothetical protein